MQLLFVAANPKTDSLLSQGREIRTIEEKLVQFNNRIMIKQKWAFNQSDFTGIFKSEPYLLHITCHGTDNGYLVFEDESGETIFYSAVDLSRRFSAAKKKKNLNNLLCVLISACYSELIAEEILDSVDCVIAMNEPITDGGASKFAGQFYKEIAYGEDLLSAFQNACDELIIAEEEKIPDIFFKSGCQLKSIDFDIDDVKLQEKIIREPFPSLFKRLSIREKIDTKLLLQIIEEGETDLTELKSTLRWNKERNIPYKKTEFRIAKSIASFMNTDGGILFIGVSNDGEIRGIEKDYTTLGKNPNKDGFSNQLKNVIRDIFDGSYPYSNLIYDNYIFIENKEICVVYVEPSPKPVYIKDGNSEIFLVRYFGSSRKLSGNAHLEYIKKQW